MERRISDPSVVSGSGGGSYSSTSNPTVNNDGVDTAGIGTSFSIGDHWVNTSTNKVYVCVDNSTGAAVWVDVTASSGGFTYVTTSDPTANNDGVDTASIGQAFSVGDHWINTSTNQIYVCVDNSTGAAVWVDVTAAGDRNIDGGRCDTIYFVNNVDGGSAC